MTEDEIIDKLRLAPHPEGGWFRQTWIEDSLDGSRPAGTCIYYLLKAGERSHWHKVDAAEIWHHYAGSPLILSVAHDSLGPATDHVLGPDLASGQAPQVVVPKNFWQAAATTGGWALVGCTVSPAFRFDGFELAPEGFDIPRV